MIYISSKPSSILGVLSETACSGEVCYGHGLSKVANWYDDTANFVNSSNPWFKRGGIRDYAATSGIYYFDCTA